MARKPRRPRKLIVGVIHARVIRGPKAGRWYWQARTYRDQVQETVWTGWGTREEISKVLAGLVLAEAKPRHQGPDPSVQKVRDLLEVWVAAQEGRSDLSKHTVHAYKNAARHLAATIGEVQVERVDTSTLQRYRESRLRSGGASGTIILELGVLRMAWRWGRDRALCPIQELPQVRVKRVSARNQRTPTPGEVTRILAELQGWPRLVTKLLYATGARIGEVAHLRGEDLDLTSGVIILRGKTGARDFPLEPALVAELRSWIQEHPSPWLFGVRPQTVTGQLRSRYLPRACKTADVAPFTPHGLRRAAVDALMRAGVDIGTAAAFLGHSPKMMLQHYRRPTMKDKREAIAAARLGSEPSGTVLEFPSIGKTET